MNGVSSAQAAVSSDVLTTLLAESNRLAMEQAEKLVKLNLEMHLASEAGKGDSIDIVI